jgi:hypothetical protein
MVPLQVIDSFLLDYEIGQALLLAFVLAIPGVLVLGSKKLLGMFLAVFGVVFLLTPQAINSKVYLFLGLSLIFVGPMIVAVARE